ncbi:MAG: plasmid maintenance system killer protein [Desulfobacteraceae bacterium]|nr:plasmid maintenance system killer protein [Desulfobacteraceae bacterium]
MIGSFKNKGTEDIFNGKNTKESRKICPNSLWIAASRKLDQIDSITYIEELRIPPGNRLESLSGDRKQEYSIRINSQYRVCFLWQDGCPSQVEIVDYH